MLQRGKVESWMTDGGQAELKVILVYGMVCIGVCGVLSRRCYREEGGLLQARID